MCHCVASYMYVAMYSESLCSLSIIASYSMSLHCVAIDTLVSLCSLITTVCHCVAYKPHCYSCHVCSLIATGSVSLCNLSLIATVCHCVAYKPHCYSVSLCSQSLIAIVVTCVASLLLAVYHCVV